MHRRQFIQLVPLTALAQTGCWSTAFYRGDGIISDVPQGISRHLITLAKVDVSKPARHAYRFAGLPIESFTIGFEIVRRAGDPRQFLDHPPLRARIRLLLTNERGEIVIDEDATLDEWAWEGAGSGNYDHSFVYRHGAIQEIPIGSNGSVRVIAKGERVDKGWGTNFSPRPQAIYFLSCEIVGPDPEGERFDVTLVGRGGYRFFL